MSNESALWATVRNNMRRHWDEATRHEDVANTGIADVSFCVGGNHGWMELKRLKEWPKRPATVVRCRHYTPEQRNFLKAKGRAGGNTWLFVQIDRDYLLFRWQDADKFGTLNTQETRALAVQTWHRHVDWEDFADILEWYESGSAEIQREPLAGDNTLEW